MALLSHFNGFADRSLRPLGHPHMIVAGVGLEPTFVRLMRPLWYHLQASRTVVPLAGIEPATSCVSGRRANQLRYKSIDLYCQRGSNP